MQPSRILFILTSATEVKGLPKPTGSWLEEVAAPYYTFLDARYDVTLASPKGGTAPVDALSLEPENQTASTRRFAADAKAQQALASTQKLADVDVSAYDALYFPGGHGTMEDFPVDAHLKAAVEQFYAAGKPVASVCHAPACFVNAKKPNGEALIKGHGFTCFSDAEETVIGLEKMVPFLLESHLNAQGGTSHVAAPFTANVVADAPLFTGQNPASAIPLAEAVIHHLRLQGAHREAA